MGSYVTSKCPRCKYVFERMNPSWIDFGDPRVQCPKCGLTVIFKNIKEWKLRHPLERFWIIFRHYTFHNLAFTGTILVVIFILLVLVTKIFGSSYDKIIGQTFEIPFWIIIGSIVFLFVAYIRHGDFIKGIRESNKRMENKEYAGQMKKLY
jgi:hypothetical protein